MNAYKRVLILIGKLINDSKYKMKFRKKPSKDYKKYKEMASMLK